jgi:splicing factor 3A subunit 1
VLMPPKGTSERLAKDVADLPEVLKRCLHRLEWDRTQQRIKQEEEDRLEEERQAQGQIDWHDFVVAETIEFDAGEEDGLPEPLAPRDLISAVKREIYGDDEEAEAEAEEAVVVAGVPQKMSAADAALLAEAAAAQGDDMEVEEEEEEAEVQMKIVRNYKRPEQVGAAAAAAEAVGYVISPITGEKVAVDEMAEHMRISLIDPKFKQQRDAMMAKLRNSTMAQDDEIGRNIMRLAKTRPDVFASTDEELGIALKGEADATKKLLEESGPGPQGVPFGVVQNSTGLKPLGGHISSGVGGVGGGAGGSLEAQIAAIHQAKQKGQLTGVANLATGTLPPMQAMPPPPKPPAAMHLRPLANMGMMPPPGPPPPMSSAMGGPPPLGMSGPPPMGMGGPPPMGMGGPPPMGMGGPPPMGMGGPPPMGMGMMPPPPMSAMGMGRPPPGPPPMGMGGPPGPPPPLAMPPLGGGMMPPPPMLPLAPPAPAPRPPPQEQPEEQPEAKRARMEEGVMVGEEEFAEMNPGPQTITVNASISAETLSLDVRPPPRCPPARHKFHGLCVVVCQRLVDAVSGMSCRVWSVRCPLLLTRVGMGVTRGCRNRPQVAMDSVTQTVQQLKAKLATLTGTAANKQKLATANGAFMKDLETLAFYNCKTGSTLSLTLKQRGKK